MLLCGGLPLSGMCLPPVDDVCGASSQQQQHGHRDNDVDDAGTCVRQGFGRRRLRGGFRRIGRLRAGLRGGVGRSAVAAICGVG